MAAPTRNLFGTDTTGATNSDTLTVEMTTMASGSQVNDIIEVFCASDGVQSQSVSSGAGWSKITQINEATSQTNLALFRFVVAVAGTVPDLVIDMGATTEMAVAHVFRIRPSTGNAVTAITPTTAQGSSTNPNPALISNGTGSAKDTYFLAVWGGDGNNVVSTAAPASYANHQSTGIANNGGANIGSADRTINAWANGANEDPGTFTRATEQWAALTVAYYESIPTQTLTPSLFTNTQTFHNATITTENAIEPALFTNAQTFFSPTIQLSGPQDLTPDLFVNSQQFPSPTIVASANIFPDLFVNSPIFYGPIISLDMPTGVFRFCPIFSDEHQRK